MVDAAAVAVAVDPITDHFGRQLLHWIVGHSSSWYSSLGGSEFIDNFKKLDGGEAILEQGLLAAKLEDDEVVEAPANLDIYSRVQRILGRNSGEGGGGGCRSRLVRRDDPRVQRNFENLMLVDIMENCEEGISVEMFNVLAPFHQNSASAATAAAGPAVQNGGGGNRGVGAGGVENMQVTQPCSAPSSPTITSPGAISSTSFCLPLTTTSSSSATGTGAGGSSTSSSVITSTTTGGGTTDTGDPNWQATKSTIRERNAAMFNNDLMADIRFIVGTDEQVQTIPAHKYVLATGSSVFYAMFYGGLAEAKEEIVVPDVEPTAFLTLLKYLYCDEIHLEADNVLATLYVAKKYIVPHLARACVNYLETSLTAKNACLLLSQSRLFEEPELMQRCWEVIDAQVCCEHRPNLEVVVPSTARQHHQRHHSYSCCQQQVLLAREKEQEEVVVVANKSSAVEGTASSSASSSATVSSSVSTSSLSTETDNPSV